MESLTPEEVLETKAGPSVRDQQLWVRNRNFLHISKYKLMFEFLKILIRTGNFFSLVLNTDQKVVIVNPLLPNTVFINNKESFSIFI